MRNGFQFLGLGIESGQGKEGLRLSARAARFHLKKTSGLKFVDHGDVATSTPSGSLRVYSSQDLKSVEWADYEQAYWQVRRLLRNKKVLVNWGGDHSMALASVGAFTSEFPDGYVLWIDAHADLNIPEASPTGYLHGMPLSFLLKLEERDKSPFPWLNIPLQPRKLICLGLRDLDPFEVHTINKLGIMAISASQVESLGIEKLARKIYQLTRHHPLHISFDIDSVDPRFAPATGVPVRGGLKPRDLWILSDVLSQHRRIHSIDVAEINPTIGEPSQVHTTFQIAIQFLKGLLKKQGGLYDGVCASTEAKHSVKMESSRSIQAKSQNDFGFWPLSDKNG